MRTPYIYFGSKGYYNNPGLAPTSGEAVYDGNDRETLTIANHGLRPDEKTTSVNPTTLGYRVLHVAADAVDDARGTDYTTDFVTGELFSSATAWGADKDADDIQAGQVTNLTSASAFTSGDSNGTLTIGDNSATGSVGGAATGITMTNNDTIIVEQFTRNIYVGNGNGATKISNGVAFPMQNFLGANPIAYAKTHYDGTALDRTDLHFLQDTGAGLDSIITLIHTAGKYPDIVKTMEAIMNCNVYDRAITFYDLDFNGKEYFAGGPSLSGNNDLGIVGCWKTVV
tara:strand:- start:107 stop:958 length:852 start_codon:yes stop_codon:yes gene_type:complete